MADIRAAFRTSDAVRDDFIAGSAKDISALGEDRVPPLDPYADEAKWPAWKVTLAVMAFCGAFWAGVAYLIYRLIA